MADFQQAARWMQQGKKVYRTSEPVEFFYVDLWGFVRYDCSNEYSDKSDMLMLEDILATNWEIYEKTQ